jgi:signal transduction histidine kinase/ActR/RegA family two-component response regulator
LSLQKELNATRNRLMTMLENQQVLADETQSMNEENLSNLEEMRSFNEELETAKEELQSTNEELTTVNDELESRNNDLQRARDFATSIVDAVWEAQLVLDKNWSVKMANEAFYQTFQLTERETKERVFFELADRALDVPALRSKLEAAFSENSGFTDLEIEVRFPQAGRKVLCVNGRRLKDDEMILLALDDITARRDAEKELDRVQEAARQGQKMEAIGRLAGGIAHDFNNLMTVVLGFSQMLIESLEKGTQAHHRATEINKAGDRAAALTRQLLAFSRRQVLQPQPLDLNSVILEMEKMLRRLIGDNIALEKTLARDLWVVCADPGQMGQVILNLALNARDAMPNGGVLTIRTANTTIKKRGKRLRNLKPGSYVSLSIQDSGEGIDQEAQQHIFEPFYTTKEQGSGTGLGLATVSGIVQQSGGSIEFESEVARGTTFWVDLPRVEAAVAIEKPVKADEVPAGTETVLVVEDEQALRAMAVEILEQLGYTVLQASQADEGLEVCRSYLSDIDLLLTDVLMPGGMSGRQLAELAALIRPGIKVLIVSGYTTDSLVHYGIEKGAPFLHKPFTVEQLACKVREVLDAGVKLDGPETNARVKRAGRSVS